MPNQVTSLHWIFERSAAAGVRLIDCLDRDTDGDRSALVDGIMAEHSSIAPKYFYDAIGSTLFEAICALPEYYPTRTENAILTEHREAIVRAIGTGKQFVDLGAGDCLKAARLLPSVHARKYVAVDIAASAIAPALLRMAPAHPGVELLGVVTDFSTTLDLSGALDDGPVTFFYPGSSIGNFSPVDAGRLLRNIRSLCRGEHSGLLIGVDAKKEQSRLEAAYDDALGVTAAFNRNILRHANALADADFLPSAFRHVAFYNSRAGRIEMHLEATVPEQVRVGNQLRQYHGGERILTEHSYKYSPAEFSSILRSAGYTKIQTWQDRAGDFSVFYAE